MIYGFWQGPAYRASTREELFSAALDQPMSAGSTFWDQAKGGVLESFGLGTAIRTLSLPPAAQTRRGRETDAEYQARQERVKGITEEEYKASPYFRENVPWDAGMTEDRAAALAAMYDAKRVREYFAEKRPITAFFGNLAGQATDPINYIPVAGPSVRAAAVARMGLVKGVAATAALDAAANTAIAGLATRETRRGFGDDVSWQAMISEIATAALIGSAFGTIGGVLERRAGLRADALRRDAEVKVQTLKATQEARIALNEAIGGLANDGEVRLSPNGVAPIERMQREFIAYHGSPHTFDRFSIDRVGTGEGAQAFGHGLYFAEKEAVAKAYQNDITAARVNAAERLLKKSGGDIDAAIAAARAEVERLRALPDGGGDVARRDSLIAMNEDKIAELGFLKETGGMSKGNLYEVAIRADPDNFLDWDKPLSEQSSGVRDRARSVFAKAFGQDNADLFMNGSGTTEEKLRAISRQTGMDAEALLREAGIPGIKYLDKDSRSAGNGSRNFVVFDDGIINIRARNGQLIDTSPARPEPPPAGRAEAEAKVAKPENYKALADQYRVDPEAGTFPEEAELRQLAQEGRLSEEDMAVLDDADAAYQDGAAYGEALKSVVNCLL
ncbi:MAG: hypothetical protein M9939_00655 [Mesorhizobium sp.]|nr:hypothetical protein [Mesorhizobium sp.]MCO5159617.1 hypothetical protein [Mesorhizobium sp.]